MEYPALTASEALEKIRAGTLTCESWAKACLDCVNRHDDLIKAMSYCNDEKVIATAQQRDRGNPDQLLHGVPVAVKDIFDTEDLPTEFNSPVYEGHQPKKDAACVSTLKAHGAVILGKAATVEFASIGRMPPTTNPHDVKRTPGGSSAGSAAAVAAGMAPIALGSQTGGSTIRPAAFCGIAAMKPTWGTVALEGMKPYAPSLDTVGWMARCVDDLELVSYALRVSRKAAPRKTKGTIGFYKTPYWEFAEQDTQSALTHTINQLQASGIKVIEVQDPIDADKLNDAQNTIMHGEGRATYLAEYLHWPDLLHPNLVSEVENSMNISDEDLQWAYDYLALRRPVFDQAMADFDAWLTPAVPGEAPLGLHSNGDAVFNRLWTGLHVPAITLPATTNTNGLPIGIQLVSGRFRDNELLACAKYIETVLSG